MARRCEPFSLPSPVTPRSIRYPFAPDLPDLPCLPRLPFLPSSPSAVSEGPLPSGASLSSLSATPSPPSPLSPPSSSPWCVTPEADSPRVNSNKSRVPIFTCDFDGLRSKVTHLLKEQEDKIAKLQKTLDEKHKQEQAEAQFREKEARRRKDAERKATKEKKELRSVTKWLIKETIKTSELENHLQRSQEEWNKRHSEQDNRITEVLHQLDQRTSQLDQQTSQLNQRTSELEQCKFELQQSHTWASKCQEMVDIYHGTLRILYATRNDQRKRELLQLIELVRQHQQRHRLQAHGDSVLDHAVVEDARASSLVDENDDEPTLRKRPRITPISREQDTDIEDERSQIKREYDDDDDMFMEEAEEAEEVEDSDDGELYIPGRD